MCALLPCHEHMRLRTGKMCQFLTPDCYWCLKSLLLPGEQKLVVKFSSWNPLNSSVAKLDRFIPPLSTTWRNNICVKHIRKNGTSFWLLTLRSASTKHSTNSFLCQDRGGKNLHGFTISAFFHVNFPELLWCGWKLSLQNWCTAYYLSVLTGKSAFAFVFWYSSPPPNSSSFLYVSCNV